VELVVERKSPRVEPVPTTGDPRMLKLAGEQQVKCLLLQYRLMVQLKQLQLLRSQPQLRRLTTPSPLTRSKPSVQPSVLVPLSPFKRKIPLH
jgi:hypothetical protein